MKFDVNKYAKYVNKYVRINMQDERQLIPSNAFILVFQNRDMKNTQKNEQHLCLKPFSQSSVL